MTFVVVVSATAVVSLAFGIAAVYFVAPSHD
jgi:hypothetical protein